MITALFLIPAVPLGVFAVLDAGRSVRDSRRVAHAIRPRHVAEALR
ncbi:hypothetical protein [Tomitella biformata]|nr:hypothetical protein [Tomitella biformata]